MRNQQTAESSKTTWIYEMIKVGKIAAHISEEDLVYVRKLSDYADIDQKLTRCHSLFEFVSLLEGCGVGQLFCDGLLVGLTAVICTDDCDYPKGTLLSFAVRPGYFNDPWTGRLCELAIKIGIKNGIATLQDKRGWPFPPFSNLVKQ